MPADHQLDPSCRVEFGEHRGHKVLVAHRPGHGQVHRPRDLRQRQARLGAIGNAATFFLFAGLSTVALAYFQRQVPETKNRSLQDIERDLDLPEPLDSRQRRPVSRARV
jgi:hypothetical protein